eukprot:Pgem_evm1s19874
MVHELLHCLGMPHSHQRSDRDNYITINLDNVPNNKRSQFATYPLVHYPLHNLPWDWKSTMLYGSYDKAINGSIKTMEFADGRVNSWTWQDYRMSDLDAEWVRRQYGCKNDSLQSRKQKLSFKELSYFDHEMYASETLLFEALDREYGASNYKKVGNTIRNFDDDFTIINNIADYIYY